MSDYDYFRRRSAICNKIALALDCDYSPVSNALTYHGIDDLQHVYEAVCGGQIESLESLKDYVATPEEEIL